MDHIFNLADQHEINANIDSDKELDLNNEEVGIEDESSIFKFPSDKSLATLEHKNSTRNEEFRIFHSSMEELILFLYYRFNFQYELAKEVLANMNSSSINKLEEILKKKNPKKKKENKTQKSFEMLLTQINPPKYHHNQVQNQGIRFSIPPNERETPKQSQISPASTDSTDYEEVLDKAILDAPILDICLVTSSDPIPPNYYRISKTPTNRKAVLTHTNNLYLCIKKDLNSNSPPITSIIIVFPNHNEVVPSGYEFVSKDGKPYNLNSGTNFEKVYIAFKREYNPQIPPISDIQLIYTSRGEKIPLNFMILNFSFSLIKSNLNPSGMECFLCYRRNFDFLTSILGINTELHDSLSKKYLDSGFYSNNDNLSNNSLDRSYRGQQVLNNAVLSPENPSSISPSSSIDNSPQPAVSTNLFPTYPEPSPLNQLTSKFSVNTDVSLENLYEVSNDYNSVQSPLNSSSPFKFNESNLKAKFSNPQYIKPFFILLSCLYLNNKKISDLSVAKFNSLLKNTNFFQSDLKSLPWNNEINPLSLVINALCSRCEVANVSEHPKIMMFFYQLIKKNGSSLPTSYLSRIYRSISFICTSLSAQNYWLQKKFTNPFGEKESSFLTPLRVIEEMVSSNSTGVELCNVAKDIPGLTQYKPSNQNLSNEDQSVTNLVSALVDEIVDEISHEHIMNTTISNYCSDIINLMNKTSKISSSGFWTSIISIGKSLFNDLELINSFSLLCALCRQANDDISLVNGNFSPKDLGVKLIALISLEGFLLSAGEKMCNSPIMGYVVRRVLVTCLVNNISHALNNILIYTNVLKIISALWSKWKQHVRIEFGILCEEYIFKILQANPSQIKLQFQLVALNEISNWTTKWIMLLEMFVNYDMDSKFQWNTFSHLIRCVTNLGKRLAYMSASVSQEFILEKEVYFLALELTGQLGKILLDSIGHAYFIKNDKNFRRKSLILDGGWINDDGNTNDSVKENELRRTLSQRLNPNFSTRKALQMSTQKLLNRAIEMHKKKQPLKKIIKYLVSNDFMPDTPQEIAYFLRIYKTLFDPESIGDFLTETGYTEEDIEYWEQIRLRYTRASSFVDMHVDSAFRYFLVGCGFKIPGEGQRIGRIIETFSVVYFQDNNGNAFCPFKNKDAVFILCFAIVMLNSDLHKNKASKRKKMTKDQFVNNVKGSEDAKNLSNEYLEAIYDSVAKVPIEMDLTLTDSNNSANSKPMVCMKFDQVASKDFISNISQSIKSSEEILRSIASTTYNFLEINVGFNTSVDLVNFMYDTVRHHFLSVVQLIFNNVNNNIDIKAILLALDILNYSLSATIFLDLIEERNSMAKLLDNFANLMESKIDPSMNFNLVKPDQDNPSNNWLKSIENGDDNSFSKLHIFLNYLRDLIQLTTNYNITRTVAKKLDKKKKILENNTFFVKEGNLVKINSNGTETLYRFFLFSDYLIYALASSFNSKLYNVHLQLSLTDLVVDDIDSEPCKFYLSHPLKSFYVIASSQHEKSAWIRDLHSTIDSCIRRNFVPKTVQTNTLNNSDSTNISLHSKDEYSAIDSTSHSVDSNFSNSSSTPTSKTIIPFEFSSTPSNLFESDPEDN